QPDDSTPSTRILRSDVKKFEKSMGMEPVTEYKGWAVASGWVGFGAGAAYGATGWGRHARPRGVLGGLLGGVLGGGLVGWLLGDVSQVTTLEEQWKKVDIKTDLQPVVTSGAGGKVLLGVAVSF